MSINQHLMDKEAFDAIHRTPEQHNKLRRQYIDEFDNIHHACHSNLLGDGGQGVVLRTEEDKETAIKFSLENGEEGHATSNPNFVKEFHSRMQKVRLLPVPAHWPLSMPLALLKNHAGYVLRLLGDMSDLHNELHISQHNTPLPPYDNIEPPPCWGGGPDWENLPEEAQRVCRRMYCYAHSGGLRRRLEIMERAACILAKIHGVGLVYADVSHKNVFASNHAGYKNVWFIDVDNMHFEGSERITLCTPSYGAPEIMRGEATASIRTDAHAFAVLVHNALLWQHPFLAGERVINGDWDTDSTEDAALRGEIPWILDPDDASNASLTTAPAPDLLLTDTLRSLFQAAFVQGRTDPLQRPLVWSWIPALAAAVDDTLECPQCQMSYYSHMAPTCPYCEQTLPAWLECCSFRWQGHPELGTPCWHFVRELSETAPSVLLPRRLFQPLYVANGAETVFTISCQPSRVLFQPDETCGLRFSIASGENNFMPCGPNFALPPDLLDRGIWLYARQEKPDTTAFPRLINLRRKRGRTS